MSDKNSVPSSREFKQNSPADLSGVIDGGTLHPGTSHERPVTRRQVEIINRFGLTLRAADQFVRLAQRFQCEIRVHYQGNACNGKSIIELMTLAAECGTRLDLEACGPDAVAAVEALAVVVAARFYEDENEWKDCA
jgi:phosphocarrier protein HPr